MSDLPDPLTPPECDLREYPWMPLDVVRLRDSELAGLRDPEAFRCAMMLFCAAWHQLPAASLPDDDTSLARLAGYGRDLKTFVAAKIAGALRGWVKCKDGRLYHAVQASKAREAWEARLAQKARTEKARAAKQAKMAVTDEPKGQPQPPVTGSVTENATDFPTRHLTGVATKPVTEAVTEPVTGSRVQDKTRQEIIEGSELRSGASPPLDVRAELWSQGPIAVERLTGKPVKSARQLIGKWLKTMGDDCAGLLAVLREAEAVRPIDPIPWLAAAVEHRRSGKPTAMDAIREEWGLPALQWHDPAPDVDPTSTPGRRLLQ